MKMLKKINWLHILVTTTVAATVIFGSSCIKAGVITAPSMLPVGIRDPVDCGYSAHYELKGGKGEFIFSTITAEGLNGHLNCGFGFVQAKVESAEIAGVSLTEREESDKLGNKKYFYKARSAFDPTKQIVSILVDNKRYSSEIASTAPTENNFNLKMNADK